MKTLLRALLPALLLIVVGAGSVQAQDRPFRFSLIYGLGLLDTDRLDATIDGDSIGVGIDTDNGFNWGGTLSWAPAENWELGVGILYRTNEFDLEGPFWQPGLAGGDYSSLSFDLEGRYLFRTSDRRVRPYLGAGVVLVQEIDIDFEDALGEEVSFENDDFGFELFGGVRFALGGRWELDVEARYLELSTPEMTLEGGDDTLRADYAPLGVNLAIGFRF